MPSNHIITSVARRKGCMSIQAISYGVGLRVLFRKDDRIKTQLKGFRITILLCILKYTCVKFMSHA